MGATTPEGYGDYFAWGETATKTTYTWPTYKYSNSGEGWWLTKYCNDVLCGYNGFTDNLIALLPEDDVATANWGSGWCMPTKEQWEELYQNTTNTWTTQNGVSGRLFTSSNSKSLFLPAAGAYGESGDLFGDGAYGLFWSSSLYINNPFDAWLFYFDSNNYGVGGDERSGGCSVRPVCSAK